MYAGTVPEALTPTRLRLADIVLDVRSGGSEAVFTYLAPSGARVGQAHLIPLGPRTAIGYVVRIYESSPEDLAFEASRLREAGDAIANLAIPEPTVDLLDFVCREYLCPLPVALGAATPPGVMERIVTTWRLAEGEAAGPFEPSALQAEVLDAVRAAGELREAKSRRLDEHVRKALRALRAKGLIRQTLEAEPIAEPREAPPLFRLTSDEDTIERFLATESKRKPAQALVVLRFQEFDRPSLAAADIKALCGVTDATVRWLSDSGLLERFDPDGGATAEPPAPNRYQRIAIDAVVQAIEDRRPETFLLFGVTGSGKTEVYLRAAAEALRLGRQVLYLVPEIALATQGIGQLRERFGKRVAILHSDLAPPERLRSWMAILAGESPVVLGARSALFAPLRDIGLIVMDEEHEGSFKQESAPRYHARALAGFLAERHRCPLVLGSATPSVESFEDAARERVTLLSLPERAANASLPAVTVEDLRSGFRSGKPSLFTDVLAEKLRSTLDSGRQAILFLNRRAYAPTLLCRDCGHTFKCPECAVSLSWSRKSGRLRCHHCGHQKPPPETCPGCGGTRMRPMGAGTEKVEEAMAELLPGVRVARLDRDVAQKRGALEKVLSEFASGETQVLVGTQMVAKGLNFPNVTLVGVIAADLALSIPDFRSGERTFQLLSQVAGRAGRGAWAGEVVIQTFNPAHRAIVCARDHDYHGFFEAERADREAAGYPPYRRLVNVLFSGEDASAVRRAADDARERLESAPEVAEVLGPVECAIERLNGRWRRHILIKMPPGSGPGPVGTALEGLSPKGVQTVIDVDPYSLM